MDRANRARRRPARIAAAGSAIAVAAGLALTFTPPAADASSSAPAAAPRVESVSVLWSQRKVKTSTKHRVTVSVDASSYFTSAGATVRLSTKSESHTWSFNTPPSALKVRASGKGTFKPKAKTTSPIAKISLALRPRGTRKTSMCDGFAGRKTQKVKVSGKFWLDTKSGKRGWGTVGRKHKAFHFTGDAVVTWAYVSNAPCENASGCYTDTTWESYSKNGHHWGDVKDKTVSADRDVDFKIPKDAGRYDLKSSKLKTAKFTHNRDTKAARLVLIGNREAGSTGSGTITGPGGRDTYTYTYDCDRDRQEIYTTWNGTFKNGSRPLNVHDIYGAIGMKAGDASIIDARVVTR